MVNELIKVSQNENGELLVSARDLHVSLEINTKFQDWFKRMLQYGFEENIDYTKIEYEVHSQKRERTYMEIDYALKIDMAKEIAMIQRNEKGKQIRLYFIECEKQLKEQIPQLTRKQQLQLQILNGSELERIGALKEYELEVTTPLIEKIKDDEPKVEAYETFMDNDGLYTVTNVAKLLDMKRDDLYKWLRDKELVYKNKRVCTVKAQNLGIMEMKIRNGFECLYITPKGVEYIRNHTKDLD